MCGRARGGALRGANRRRPSRAALGLIRYLARVRPLSPRREPKPACASHKSVRRYCTSRTQGATLSGAGEAFGDNRECAIGIDPGRLWSLLDMYEINSIGVSVVLARLGRAQGIVNGLRIAGRISELDMPVTPEARASVAQLAEEMLAVMGGMGVTAALAACGRLEYNLKNNAKLTYKEMGAACSDIESRLRDEMSAVMLLQIESTHVKYFSPQEPLFGYEVALKFNSVAYEIEEAGKCLALDRSTASAFHSIRCLEGGIRAIARCLGIPDPTRGANRSWMKVLGAIEGEIDKRWPPALVRIGDAELFENAYAALSGMQNPWRNATMHLDQKYTLEEARHIFEVVKGFMRKLASRMDENGLPLA
jgi:hypothetical protein